jgi:hypothetical protein
MAPPVISPVSHYSDKLTQLWNKMGALICMKKQVQIATGHMIKVKGCRPSGI